MSPISFFWDNSFSFETNTGFSSFMKFSNFFLFLCKSICPHTLLQPPQSYTQHVPATPSSGATGNDYFRFYFLELSFKHPVSHKAFPLIHEDFSSHLHQHLRFEIWGRKAQGIHSQSHNIAHILPNVLNALLNVHCFKNPTAVSSKGDWNSKLKGIVPREGVPSEMMASRFSNLCLGIETAVPELNNATQQHLPLTSPNTQCLRKESHKDPALTPSSL